MLFKCVKRGGCQVPTRQIAGGRFAELLIASGEIKDVINDLKGQTKLTTELIQPIKLLGSAATQHTRSSDTVGDQRGGLAVTLLQVGLEGLGRVKAVKPLFHFPVRQVHDHPAEQFDHLKIIEIGQVPAGLGEQKITGENGNSRVETTVDRIDAASGGGLVHNVVVNQRCGVNHFRDLSQPAVSGRELTVRCQAAGHQQNDAWTQSFATCTEQVLSCGLKDRMSCSNETPQVTEQGLEIVLDRLKQLGERDHGTPRRGDPSGLVFRFAGAED